MRPVAIRFRWLLALALLAWSAMVFAQPLPVMQSAPAMTHVAPMLHAGQPMAAHRANSSAAGHDCCGHARHACDGGHCCGCIGAYAIAVLPVAALPMQVPRAGNDRLRPRQAAIAAMFTTPPLRPPAA